MLNYANSKYFIQSLNTICYHESSGLTSHLSNATPRSGLKLSRVPPLSSKWHRTKCVTNQCHRAGQSPPLAGPRVAWPPSVTGPRCHRSPSQSETGKLSLVSLLGTNGRTSGQAPAGTELDLQSPALSITTQPSRLAMLAETGCYQLHLSLPQLTWWQQQPNRKLKIPS